MVGGGIDVISQVETDSIYFSKTKEYFREVLSSYGSRNYRSAVVMLYSVVVCDLLLKLEELSDTYNDGVAKNILKKVRDSKNDQTKSKSRWEWELIQEIKDKTSFFDLEAYMNLEHLYDFRNMCAHPTVNDTFELYAPNQETVIALIRNTVSTILVKPPVFIKGVIDALTDDLASKREIYEQDREHLKIYLDNKYFSHMTDVMKVKTVKALWRFVFVSEDELCEENRMINRRALEVLIPEIKSDFLRDMATDRQKYQLSDSERNQTFLAVLLARFPEIYKELESEIRFKLDKHIDSIPYLRAIAWFRTNNSKEFFETLSADEPLDKEVFEYIYNHAVESGDRSLFLDYTIRYYNASKNFNMADQRWADAVAPSLDFYSADQLLDLVAAINRNNQIYNRGRAFSANTLLAEVIFERVSGDFDFSKYSNFFFDKERAKKQTIKETESSEMIFD